MTQEYIIMNAARRLYYGKKGHNTFYQTPDLSEAVHLPMDKAEKFLCNSIPKKERHEWSVSPAPSPMEISETRFDKAPFDWESAAKELQSFYAELAAYSASQRKALSKADQEFCDIAHFLEFNRPRVLDGYQTSMMLHTLRLRRRAIKDGIYCAELFLSADVDAVIGGELLIKLNAMKQRRYVPRVLPELFKNSAKCA